MRALGALALLCGAGCDNPQITIQQLRERVTSQETRISQLERDLLSMEEELKTRKGQIERLQKLGPRRLELLNPPARIEVDKLSGGYDADGKPGDDGLAVYLRVYDQTGDAIKAAGEIEIQLWDLEAGPDQLLVGHYIFDVEHAMKNWYGKFMTYHYALKCPWRQSPPAHAEITVKARFVDYLTGQVFTDQRLCRVTLPGPISRQP